MPVRQTNRIIIGKLNIIMACLRIRSFFYAEEHIKVTEKVFYRTRIFNRNGE